MFAYIYLTVYTCIEFPFECVYLYSNTAALKQERSSMGISEDTRGSTSGGSSRDITNTRKQPKLLKTLGVSHNNKCTGHRASIEQGNAYIEQGNALVMIMND